MRINNPVLKSILNSPETKVTVIGSIAGKYVFLEVPYEGTTASEELENESGEIMYFKTEKDAYDMLEKIKSL